MPSRYLALLAVLLISACAPSGPATTNTTSAAMTSLAEKAEFLERYVKFRRAYLSLDFSVEYQNNGGGLVPGPSGWDIRIVATVPAEDLDSWIDADLKKVPAPNAEWLNTVPTAQDVSSVNEWYEKGGRTIGIDRERSIVVYRALSN